jgi:hypothetical protein
LGAGVSRLGVRLCIRSPSMLVFLESSVQIGYVAPGILSCLSPGDGMIPDDGIIAHPNGMRRMITWLEFELSMVGICSNKVVVSGLWMLSLAGRCRHVMCWVGGQFFF